MKFLGYVSVRGWLELEVLATGTLGALLAEGDLFPTCTTSVERMRVSSYFCGEDVDFTPTGEENHSHSTGKESREREKSASSFLFQ
jgi:hypothetical protein